MHHHPTTTNGVMVPVFHCALALRPRIDLDGVLPYTCARRMGPRRQSTVNVQRSTDGDGQCKSVTSKFQMCYDTYIQHIQR